MAFGIIFAALILSAMAMPLQKDVPQSSDYDYEDDYYDDPEPISDSEEIQENKDIALDLAVNPKEPQTKNPKIVKPEREREELTTEKQLAKYEVTEFVIDVPDENTRRVPIITNFTLTRPLNIAGEPNKTNNVEENVKDVGDEIINFILTPTIPKDINNNQFKNVKVNNNKFDFNKDESDFFSNSHPKASFEEEFDKEFDSEDDDDDFDSKGEEGSEPSKGFKDHLQNFRKSIVDEFKSVVNKHKDGFHDSLREIVNGPISFFNKLHKKSSDLAKKLHNAVSRHKIHDQDDDIGSHEFDHDFDD